MGKRGPKPTPTPILRLRGSWKANDRADEPKAVVNLTPCPTWVSEKGRAHWDEIVGVLYGLGVMSDVHAVALSLLVEAVADWLMLKSLADETPLVTTGESGASFAHPVHGMKGKAWERVLKACREFGMTPSAISGVKSVQKQEQKGLAAFRLAK